MRRLPSTLVIIAVAGLLCACGTQPQRQFQSMRTKNQENLLQFRACVDAVHNLPEYALLRPHVPPSIQSTTLDQLSDKSFATPEEAQAIFATHPSLQQCRKSFLDGVAKSEPSVVPILVASYNKADDAAIGLAQRKISWGDYTHRLRDNASETQATLQVEDRRVVSGLKEEHEAELARRERAAEAIAAWAQTQQLINAANRPVITNCNRFGNMVNCITQ